MEEMNEVFGIFTTLKGHKAEWTPLSTRKFSEKEMSCISKCFIYIGKYKPAVCFLAKNGKRFYIDLDNSHIGDFDGDEEVEMSTMNIVKLKYTGDHPETLKDGKDVITRIKFDDPEEQSKEVDFDDPFGVNN